MKQLLILFSTYLMMIGCQKTTPTHNYTFYYWRTKLTLNDTEKISLSNATTNSLYTRYFDIDKLNGKFFPVGTITKDSSFVTDKTITPVIYITNRSMIGITNEEIHFLAKSIDYLVKKKNKEFNLKTSNEIQIDCDWTAGTRDDYFNFLNTLKAKTGKKITSTLRLHQVKDRNKMGVPPVDKVYLMCYSTSSPLENSDQNSILEIALLKNYLAKLNTYPIKTIDIALPLYSWAIVTNHLGKHKLINGISTKDLNQPNLRKINDHTVEVTKDDFYFGHYLNKGFIVKVEEIPTEDLEHVLSFIDTKIRNYSIVYYHLDSKFISNYNL